MSPRPTNSQNQQLRFDWSSQFPDKHLSPQAAPAPCNAPDPPSQERHPYQPGHPWHYLARGDNAPPVPFEQIPPGEEAAKAMRDELPKSVGKRIIAARGRLESERRELESIRLRYHEVIDRGAEALSRFDREIAYGGDDEMARAGTLALLFNQIGWHKGRISTLESEVRAGTSRRR